MPKLHATFIFPLVISAALLMGFAQPPGDELVENGDFETGSLAGWTQQDMTESGAWFVYSGTQRPLGGDTILPPPVGDFAAVTDQGEPDSNILFQDIEVPRNSEATCSLIVYYENRAVEGFAIGDGLNIGNVSNQQFRIDIMDPDADPFDTGAGVLLNLFQTLPGDPQSLGYTTINFDLTLFAGQTVRLRAAVAVTVEVLNGSIDAVTCIAVPASRPIPTLSEWGLIVMAGLLGIIGLLAVRRRKAAP